MTSPTYKSAGVDLELYQQAMQRLPRHVQKTHGPQVMPLTGGFAGLFQLNGAGKSYRDPVLVSGTDGVGTKLCVARMAGVYDTIGIDLVGMCVNDCLCLGAEPLFFLDYIALGKDNPQVIEQLVAGISEGCLRAKASLIGGETAIMPDLYGTDDFDLAGFCVGVVERDEIIDGSKIAPGDVVIGIPSSGFHSNGYSLIRKVVFEMAGLNVDSTIDALGGTVGELLLTPTRIYTETLNTIFASAPRSSLHGIAHITGGGLCENVERIVPSNCSITISQDAWRIPPLFTWLQELGGIAADEMFRVFNMGIGLVLVVDQSAADTLLGHSEQECVVLGEVRKGERRVSLA